MLVELTVPWLIAVDFAAWLFLHLCIAWGGTRLPGRLFDPDQWLYRERSWEKQGRFYERLFLIRRWKRLLPDGAALFSGGFRKGRLASASPQYIERFIRETCRGESVHWVVFASGLLFFLWNPWRIGLIIMLYAALANLPCILTQRYNRLRLHPLQARIKRRATLMGP